MNILAFDTCYDACSVAIGSGAHVLAHRFEPMRTGHAERLFPMIEDCLAEASLAIQDIDRLAVTHGPGTFTGTRISVAAARALALALPVDVASFSSLQVIAQRALEPGRAGPEHEQGAGRDFRLVVVRPPRRGAFDGQVFDASGSVICDPLAASAERFGPFLEGSRKLLVAGPGADEFLQELSGRPIEVAGLAAALPGEKHIPQDTEPDARYLLGLAAAHTTQVAQDARPRPLYLRPADAKPSMKPGIARTS